MGISLFSFKTIRSIHDPAAALILSGVLQNMNEVPDLTSNQFFIFNHESEL